MPRITRDLKMFDLRVVVGVEAVAIPEDSASPAPSTPLGTGPVLVRTK